MTPEQEAARQRAFDAIELAVASLAIPRPGKDGAADYERAYERACRDKDERRA